MTRNVLLGLGVLLVGLAVWLVDEKQLASRAAFLERDGQRIDTLLAGRLAFEVSVLEARAGLQLNFDPVNRALSVLREAGAEAETLQTRGAAGAAAAAQIALAAHALEREEAALEQFKTDLALLRLASHGFPLAADTLIRRAETSARHGPRSALSDELTTLAALRTDLERYEELPAADVTQRLERELSTLQALRATLDDGGREELDVLVGHTRAILDRRERVDQFARVLVRSPVRAHLTAARTAFERSARGRAQQVGALQLLSGILALGGVMLLASAALRSARRPRR